MYQYVPIFLCIFAKCFIGLATAWMARTIHSSQGEIQRLSLKLAIEASNKFKNLKLRENEKFRCIRIR